MDSRWKVKLVRTRGGALLVLLLLLCLTAGLASCSSATDATKEQGPSNFELGGKDEAARLEALRAAARTAPVDVFYLGDPYDGMTMDSITAFPTESFQSHSVMIDYRTDSGDILLLIMYTPKQYDGSGYRSWEQNPVIGSFPIQGGTANVHKAPDRSGAPPGRTTVIAKTERTVLVMTSEPDLGPERMSDAAAHLIPVTQ